MKIFYAALIGTAISCGLIVSAFALPAGNIAQANNEFAFDLYSRLDSQSGNIFFSPYSLTSALTMTFEGARGPTSDEMRMALYLPSDEVDWRTDLTSFIQRINSPNKDYALSVANALWVQKAYPFKEDYLNLVKNTYFAEARNLNFAADPEGSRGTINGWVSDHTNNRINDLLPNGSITPNTRFVLTNAVYFKGKWETPFKIENTKFGAFWLTPDQSVQTNMMSLAGESFLYAENDQAQVLQLPYQGNDLSMLIILPRSKNLIGLEKSLTFEMLKQWRDESISQNVDVIFPKFKFDANYQMKDILTGMGINLAFDDKKADFSGMTGNKDLYIDQVYHKAWIEVNEEGTEAAAATAVVMSLGMAYNPPQPKEFRADHPFIFMIQDNKTGHILFMGRVSDPREKS